MLEERLSRSHFWGIEPLDTLLALAVDYGKDTLSKAYRWQPEGSDVRARSAIPCTKALKGEALPESPHVIMRGKQGLQGLTVIEVPGKPANSSAHKAVPVALDKQPEALPALSAPVSRDRQLALLLPLPLLLHVQQGGSAQGATHNLKRTPADMSG